MNILQREAYMDTAEWTPTTDRIGNQERTMSGPSFDCGVRQSEHRAVTISLEW